MTNPRFMVSAFRSRIAWRHYLLATIGLGSLALMTSLAPIGQPTEYHSFVDQRSLYGIPNFLDVASNLPFLLAGTVGVIFSFRNHVGDARNAWLTLFIGITFVSLGSAYYHWTPTNTTLVWDRLPMTIAFMGLFAALVGEYVNPRLGKVLLFPAVLAGLFSVLYWDWSDDLRLYAWVQLLPLLTIPVLMLLYRPRYSHQWLLLAGFSLYALAKVAELLDREVFALTGSLVSGHSVKHLLAALGVFAVYWMVRSRHEFDSPTPQEASGLVS